MDYTNIIIAVCTVVTTVGSLMLILARKFEKIDEELKSLRLDFNFSLRGIENRLSRIEGYIEGRDISLKAKTGTTNEVDQN